MKRNHNFLLILLTCFLVWQCGGKPAAGQQNETTEMSATSPLDRLPDNEAGDVIRQAIEYAGGWEEWAGKKSFSFYKVITYYDSTGAEERSLRQLHQYQLSPSFKARMSWENGGDNYLIINNGQQAWMYRNDELQIDQASKNQAWNSSFGSNYVVSMPFKLTDPGVILSYEGLDTLADGRIVESVKVEYEEGAGSSGGLHHWWYYFEPETGDLSANFLDHGAGYSYTTYETFTTVDGIRIHQKRYSYITNEEKEPLYLRTVYENEGMQFDVPLTEDMFEPLHEEEG